MARCMHRIHYRHTLSCDTLMKKFLIDLLLIVWLINSAVLISEISLSLDTN